ncbi:MAG: hypothetical protein K6G56_04780 [Clostridiales bacterium]|nr:hypothetical protein [Clostridiales bacterium]
MKTKKLKKLMTAALCVIFAVCFAFPASAYSTSVNHSELHTGGLVTRYRGHAEQCTSLGTNFIACNLDFAETYIQPDYPESSHCWGYLTVKDINKTHTIIIHADNESIGLGTYKSGTIGFDPYYYKYEYGIDSFGYLYSNMN